ncbi:hypothetical protein [Halopseudomonas salegens]|uniref:Uncharacterized protein n=1 Tax=Halopseudomonas salegens TaxID=1434072 RepID=A0A1H2EVC7_9GAMM|nr:hypothetical protein [Halopseudomonas salegens]SDT98933.1 hypothetical protein SAMN05216210_1060 [Halopseudomonas salegens]
MFIDSRLGINLHIGFSAKATGQFYNPTALLDTFERQQSARLMPETSHEQFMHYLWADRMAYQQRERPANQIPPAIRAAQPVPDIWLNELGKRWALQFIQENPGQAVALSGKKFASFWGLEQRLYLYAYRNNFFGEIHLIWRLLGIFLVLLPFPILVLMAIADNCREQGFSHTRWLLLLMPITYFTAIHSVIFGGARFHFVLIPLLALMAANAWSLRAETLAMLRGQSKAPQWRRVCCLSLWFGCLLIWAWGQWQARGDWQAFFSPGAHLVPANF